MIIIARLPIWVLLFCISSAVASNLETAILMPSLRTCGATWATFL